MTPTERRLFKEAVIREYKLKDERAQRKNTLYNLFVRRVKRVAAASITIGIIASLVFWTWQGLEALILTLLTATIWITVVGTILSALLKSKK